MRRRRKLGILAMLMGAALVPAALSLSRGPAARPGQPVAPAGQMVPAAESHAVVPGQPGSVPDPVATPALPSAPAQVAPFTGPGPDAGRPAGTPPGAKVDEQEQEGPADQRDQGERESENTNDDKPGDPGDAPGADHRCPPDCRSGELG